MPTMCGHGHAVTPRRRCMFTREGVGALYQDLCRNRVPRWVGRTGAQRRGRSAGRRERTGDTPQSRRFRRAAGSRRQRAARAEGLPRALSICNERRCRARCRASLRAPRRTICHGALADADRRRDRLRGRAHCLDPLVVHLVTVVRTHAAHDAGTLSAGSPTSRASPHARDAPVPPPHRRRRAARVH